MRSLEFDIAAFGDLACGFSKIAAKRYVLSIDRGYPFKGIGKPEPLKHAPKGCWSRRIDREHRLVYRVTDEKVRLLARRYHY